VDDRRLHGGGEREAHVEAHGVLVVESPDDPTCQGRTYTAGESFVDRGDETVHTARNLGPMPVELWATYLVPGDPGAPFRIDAADPACDF
jgi:hypothetical protein